VIVAEVLEGTNEIVLHADFRDNERVKIVPGHKFKRALSKWTVPLSWASCVVLRGVFGAELQIGPKLWEWAAAEKARRIDPCLALRAADEVPLEQWDWQASELDSRLYPLQRVAVEFMRHASTLLADPPGGGKTVMAIRSLERVAALYGKGVAYPAIVVCPSSMRWTWEAEFKTWAPERTVAVVDGSAAARKKAILSGADVVVVHWDVLWRHSRLAPYGSVRLLDKEKEEKELNQIGAKAIIADEVHRAKNATAKTTRALWWLGDHANLKHGLSGTPLPNVPEDLWAVMRYISPHEFPSKVAYINRWVEQAWSPFGFSQSVGLQMGTKDEFFAIVDPRMLRRPKERLVPGLPEKLPPQVRYVELGTKQRKAYDEMRKHMLAELESGTLVETSPLQKTLRLVQLASAYGEVEQVGTNEDGSPKYQLTLVDPSCKVDALQEFITDELNDKSLVVFADSVQLIRIAAARLQSMGITWGAVTGDVAGEARQLHINEFQAGERQIMLCTYKAGAEGLTLTRASTVVRLQRSWSNVENLQSEDRVHRVGQTEEVSIIDFVARKTVESRVIASGAAKAARLEELVRDEQTLRDWLEK
jgi:SNF2 family DNA or RNA helicase